MYIHYVIGVVKLLLKTHEKLIYFGGSWTVTATVLPRAGFEPMRLGDQGDVERPSLDPSGQRDIPLVEGIWRPFPCLLNPLHGFPLPF